MTSPKRPSSCWSSIVLICSKCWLVIFQPNFWSGCYIGLGAWLPGHLLLLDSMAPRLYSRPAKGGGKGKARQGTSMLDRKFQALTDRMVHQLSTLSIQPKAKAQPRGKGSGGKRRPRRSGPTLSARPQLGYALATVPRHTMLTRKENFFSHKFLTLPIGGTITAETYYFLFWPHNGVKNMMFLTEFAELCCG